MSADRDRPTAPPPPSARSVRALSESITSLRAIAGSILARANELEQVAKALEGDQS
jgi:hypothetical protein